MLKTHRAGKGPGDCGRWDLGSRNIRGPGVTPTPGLRGQGTSPGSPAGFLGLSGQGKHPPLLSFSYSLWSGKAPPTCLSSSPQPPSYAPRTNAAGREGWALVDRGPAWELSRLPVPEWAGQSPSTPLLLLLDGPSCLPLLISLASGAPILSGLHFSSPLSPPTSYWFTLGFLSSPWASESPTSGRQVP